MKYYAIFESPDGAYADAAGLRYDVCVVRRVRSPQGLNVGYVEFPSLAAALEHWGLVAAPAAVDVSFSQPQQNDEILTNQ